MQPVLPNLVHAALYQTCGVEETTRMEHILLQCTHQDRQEVWTLAQSTWERRGIPWSALSWGLLLGCGLIGFRSTGKETTTRANEALPDTRYGGRTWNLRSHRTFRPEQAEADIQVLWWSSLKAC